jgi:hypothetical protein
MKMLEVSVSATEVAFAKLSPVQNIDKCDGGFK